MMLLNISGSAARQTWPLTYLMEQHYRFIFSWGLIDALKLLLLFFHLFTSILVFSVFDNLHPKGCLTNLSIFLFPMQEKIDVILATAAAWTFVTPHWKKQWTEGLHVWTPHVSAASTLYCRCLSARGVDHTVTSGQRNVRVHASTAVCLCLRVFGLK